MKRARTMRILKFYNKYRSDIRLRTVILLFIPIVVVLIFSTAMTAYNITLETRDLKNEYRNSLEQASQKSETEINTCIKYISMLENNPSIVSALNGSYTDIETVQKALKKARDTFYSIDSVFILDRENHTIISEEYSMPLSEYLDNHYKYTSYDSNYWEKLKIFDSSPYRIMSPSIVTSGVESKKIIPVVFRQLNDTKTRNYLILNISLDILLDAVDSDRYTKNTYIFVMNKYTGQIFNTNGGLSDRIIRNEPIYRCLILNNISFEYRDHGTKYIFCTYSSSDSLLGYTYFACTPYMDIVRMQYPRIALSIISILLLLFFSYLITLKNAGKIFSPLEQVAQTFNKGELPGDVPADFFEYLQSSAKYLVKNNSELSNVLPYAQEKYLINYLNMSEYTIDESAKEVIKQSLPFKYNYFCSVIIQLYPTNLLYDSYTNAEYINIQSGFYNIVKEYFTSKFETFIISSEKDTLYIIINTDNESPEEDIRSILTQIRECLANDTDFVELFIGLGKTHPDLTGLKKSHEEAINSLQITPKSRSQILFNVDKTVKYVFSNADEEDLLSALLENNPDRAVEIINYSLKRNEHIDNRSLKQLYSQILNIILKAIRIKKISFNKQNKYDFEINYELMLKTPTEIHKTILSMIELFRTKTKKESSAENIVNYIKDNFRNNSLSLDSIAHEFDVNSSYLSTLLKNTLSIGFHDYLNRLRITEAKRLLTETDTPIQDIFVEVGYNNKQTFIRAFRAVTHVTPSEFRKKKHVR